MEQSSILFTIANFMCFLFSPMQFYRNSPQHIITMAGPMLPPSPVALAFPRIEWDQLGSLRLTAQETALLRMAETNPIEYTLADSRDASMYARVLLKLLAEASAAGAGFGEYEIAISYKRFVLFVIMKSNFSSNK